LVKGDNVSMESANALKSHLEVRIIFF
jgi:hypothetical protein